MQTRFKLFLSGLALTAVAACGETPLQQTVFGAGAGAGTAAVFDGDIALGVVAGAAGNVLYCQTYPERCN